jgi:sulfide:quinone oxidoreductase
MRAPPAAAHGQAGHRPSAPWMTSSRDSPRTPKARNLAEGAAGAVASSLIARIRSDGVGRGRRYPGAGTCHIGFGAGRIGRIGRVDVDFFSGPKPIGRYHEPSLALREDKKQFGASRRARWFSV